jgi:RHS repeat-associated protein
LLREYVWAGDRILAVIEGGAVYHVRTDHIGRPVLATDGSGLKVWEASYLPFGGVHVATSFPGAATDPLDLRFPGQWFQAESGLHQNWMRDYDPTTGRYIQADPLGLVDGASVYGYAIQSPMRWTDPRGEAVWVPIIAIAVFASTALTPDAANAPGQCDPIVHNNHARPYVNGIMAASIVSGVQAGVTAFTLPRSYPAFSQTTASFHFGRDGRFAGQTIDDLASAIRSGAVKVRDVPVETITREGTRLAMNTRSLLALRQAGVPASQIRYVNVTGQARPEAVLSQRLANNGLTGSGIRTIRVTGFGQSASRIK